MAEGATVGQINIRVLPDTSKFRQQLQRQLQAVEKALEVAVDVAPDTSGFRKKVQAATSGLKAEVDLDVNRSMLGRLRDKINNSFSNIEFPDPKMKGLNLAGAGLAGLTGVLALAAPAVGLITAALTALPGVIAAVAAPIGALTLGMDGLKLAAARLTEPFAQLKATMSAATEAQFGPVFEKLGAIFPLLGKSLPAVSQGMADLAKSVVDTVTSSSGMAKIEAAIGNIGKALSTAGPGIGAFTSGLLTLVEQFTGKLPNLAEWFNSAGASFDAWVTKITADGTLSKAFEGLGSTLKTIGEALGGIASAGIEFFSDPARIEGFNSALAGIGSLLKSAVEDSVRFYDVLNQIGAVFTNFDFSGIIADLTQPFTSAEAPWRNMWASLVSGATSAWASVTATVSGAVASIGSTVSSMAASLTGVWSGITAAASAAWSGVVSTVSGAWQQIVAAVSSGVDQAVSFVASLPGKIASALAGLAGIGADAGRALGQGLISGISGMISGAVAKAREMASQVAGAVKGFLGINSPSTVFAGFGANVGQGFVQGLESQYKPVADAAAKMGEIASKAFQPELSSTASDTANQLNGMANKLPKMGYDFAKSNLDQLQSDLNIGGGALTEISGLMSEWAMSQMGNGLTINVGSVDDAIAAKNNHLNKMALQYVGR